MKAILLKITLIAVLVVIFTIGTVLAPLALLFRPSATFKAMNRLCGAAWLGFSGEKTISKECGQELERAKVERRRPCKFCERLCKFLDAGDPGHCPKEAA